MLIFAVCMNSISVVLKLTTDAKGCTHIAPSLALRTSCITHNGRLRQPPCYDEGFFSLLEVKICLFQFLEDLSHRRVN